MEMKKSIVKTLSNGLLIEKIDFYGTRFKVRRKGYYVGKVKDGGYRSLNSALKFAKTFYG